MDIKFIGSGKSAKAVLYYTTDYITKSQLKAHVAFAALELAVRKLDEQLASMAPTDPEVQAKKLLQKCAFSLISKQELSAPQVMSYLLGYGDHYIDHKFCRFFWTSFERFVDKEYPLSLSGTEPQQTDHSPDRDTNDDNQEGENVDVSVSDDDEIVVSEHHGSLFAHSTHIADYQFRGEKLLKILLWEYLSAVEKVTDSSSSLNDIASNTEFPEPDDMDNSFEDILNVTTWKRPRARFDPLHPDHTSHLQRIIAPNKRLIMVPVGLSIPRRDRPDQLEQYKRLMLVLFKPWTNLKDLKEEYSSWDEAFESFIVDCPQELKDIMDNMQLMHECKDSRDDHFAERLKKRQAQRRTDSGGTGAYCDNLATDNVTEDILTHIQDVDLCFSEKIANTHSNTSDCLKHTEAGGIFQRQYTFNKTFPTREQL